MVRRIEVTAALWLLGACAPAPETPRLSSAAPAGEAAATAPEAEDPAGGAPMPGPARGRQMAAVRDNQACEGCHEDVAREWRGSLHQRADLEPAYRRAFAIEPMPFCRSCHAPEATPTEPEGEEVAALGVGCVTCHVTRGAGVLAAPWAGAGAPPAAPHAVIRDARFAGADACASCHEFAFPMARGRQLADLMQSTVTEHRASTAAAEPCAGCHMPREGGGEAGLPGGDVARGAAAPRRSHAFVGSRDAGFVRSAVRVEAARVSPTRVAISIAPTAALGHAFPTGDLFRRLEVSAEAAGADDMVLGQALRYLTRHFVAPPGQIGRRLVADDRVHGEPLTVELDVGAAGEGRPIVWRVAYQRVAHPVGVDDREAEVEGEITVAAGRLSP